MGKNAKKSRSNVPAEEHLVMPSRETITPIVDTHTHIASTFETYRSKYKEGKHATVFDFIKSMTSGQNVESIVDVWCEAPVESGWKELADSAVAEADRKEKWGGVNYWFVMGVHPHNAIKYDDAVEKILLEAMDHPRCVGWGEIGLDYHYDNSPREIQQEIFERQLKHAVRLGKPLTVHTREAEEDTERIMKAVIPKEHKIHIHCFTDSPEFAGRLLDHFPNLYIGVTGVITYSTNVNTSNILKNMIPSPSPRIVLETDGPYMVPANLYTAAHMKGVSRLPLCHTGMIPWTAQFAADVFGEGWDAERVMAVAKENARKVYGI